MTESSSQQTILNLHDITINPVFINNHDDLLLELPFLNSCASIGVDVEFPAMRRFIDRISLIQIGNTEKQLIIDVEEFFPNELKPIFKSNSIKKHFFVCNQDITMIKQFFRSPIRNISDVSYNYSYYKNNNNQNNLTGLDGVINYFYGNIKSRKEKKQFQLFDWLRRPLPQDALEYAASDVAYLIPIDNYLIQKLYEIGYQDDLERSSKSYELYRQIDQDLSLIFLKFKTVNEFKSRLDRLLAFNIQEFRFQKAKIVDKPIHYIFDNECLRKFTKIKPQNNEEIKNILPKKYKDNQPLINDIQRIIQNSVEEFNNNELNYFYKVHIFSNAINVVDRKNAEILSLKNFNLAVLGNDNYIEINKRIEILKRWRKLKAHSLNMPIELFLPLITIKFLSMRYPNEETLINTFGINQNFWNKYHSEVMFWLSNSDVILKHN